MFGFNQGQSRGIKNIASQHILARGKPKKHEHTTSSDEEKRSGGDHNHQQERLRNEELKRNWDLHHPKPTPHRSAKK